MPPKKPKSPAKTPKGKKEKDLEKYPDGEVPDPTYALNATPMVAREGAFNALVPYLALGFGPVNTSGGDAMCGLNALHISLQAALNVHNFDSGPKAKEITRGELLKLLKSDDYTKLAQNRLNNPNRPYAGMALDNAVYLEHQQILLARTFLNIENIHFLLMLANQRWKMNFVLGVITEGYQVRWNTRTGAFENWYIQPTSAAVNASNRPVVWIYNSGVAGRYRARSGVASTSGGEHWEGMAPLPKTKDGRDRQQIVNNWALQQRIVDDMTTGIWRATTNLAGDNLQGDPSFAVEAGHFLRETPLPGPGYTSDAANRHMRLCDIELGRDSEIVQLEGWVRNEYLEKMVLTVQPGTPDPINEAPPHPPAVEPKEGDAPKKDKAAKKDKEAKKDDDEELIPQTKIFFTTIEQIEKGNNVRFKIFRSVPLSNKIGFLIEPEGFSGKDAAVSPLPGNFFLDTMEREEVAKAFVIGVDGYPGFFGLSPIELRSLQAITSPWGLPEYLPALSGAAPSITPPPATPSPPVTPTNPVPDPNAPVTPGGTYPGSDKPVPAKSLWTREHGLITPRHTSAEIREVAAALGHNSKGGNKLDILAATIAAEIAKAPPVAAAPAVDPVGNHLHMYRLNRNVPGGSAAAPQIDFIAQEMVMAYSYENDGAWIVDYEGNPGWVGLECLDFLDNAWGLEVDLRYLNMEVTAKRPAEDDPPETPAKKKMKLTTGYPTPRDTPKK